jgi:arylsulfatase A-like enzyme
MLQVDHTVGQVLEALERNKIAENTLIIFTSDNGCSNQADFQELAGYGHDPSFGFRGHKADIFEGGHRVPFLARWPEKIKPGSGSNQVICLTDLLATVSGITGGSLGPDEGVDSYNLYPVLLDPDTTQVREATVHHSVNGSFAIRKDNWKLILCPGSGGWSIPKPGSPDEEGLPEFQLYNLEEDPAETTNRLNDNPEVLSELKDLLAEYIRRGRSTPGPEAEYVNQVSWPGLDWMLE